MPTTKKQELEDLFRRKLVVDLQELRVVFKERSDRSLYRDLTKAGYLSSYSHAGRFYTLKDIPSFDKNGLWQHRNKVLFSKYGTLKETIRALVTDSESGYSHRELAQLLLIRIQNTLNDLISNKMLNRELIQGVFVYVDINSACAQFQLCHRDKILRETRRREPPLDRNTVIEILVTLLCEDTWDPRGIARTVRAQGVYTTKEDVLSVLQHYGLKKKLLD